MKVSLNWLRRYLPNLQASVEEISKALTSVGLEVEGIEDFGAAFKGLIVAKVVHCERHPEADKLSVTKVFDGQNEIQVVCGAPNVAAGQTVVFAPLGTSLPLPDGTELKLKKIKLRGVESSGMICAEDEIGLGDSHDGIMVLSDTLAAGTPFASLPDTYDVVYEINVTPNRPDALSHIGVARELARVFGIDLILPQAAALPATGPATESTLQLHVQDGAGCSRYIARTISGVKVGPSPLWLQRLLNSLGLRPISNVVDITNFVLLEWGQPLHAFDLDKISSKSLKVRTAQAGETLTTLDDVQRTLNAGELLICDGDTPACVAGVMGGKDTEVDENTVNIALETAYFHGPVIRRQARRLALHSDSSHRFERGIDPTRTAEISAYAAALIAEICGGTLSSSALEYTGAEHPSGTSRVNLRLGRVAQILGYAPSAEEVRACLCGIGLVELGFDNEIFTFETPGFRPDLEREIDLIEEVARLLGYDRVPTIFPALVMRANALPKNEQISRKTRQFLAARGLHEGLSLRFESVKTLETLLGAQAAESTVALQNPLSEEWAVLPPTFLGRMVKAASYNLRQQEKYVRLFEIAKTFAPCERQDIKKDNGVIETQVLAGILAGDFELGLADKAAQVEFADVRALLDGLFRDLRLNVQWKRPESGLSFLHPLRQAEVVLGNQVLGYMGELHPATAQSMEVDRVAYVFEFNFDQIVKKALSNNVFKPFSRFGAMNRDLSLLVDERTDVNEVRNAIGKAKAKNLKSVELRSVYQGPGIEEGKKSLLFQFIYQADDRTLTDEEVNQAHDKLRQNLAQNDQWSFR